MIIFKTKTIFDLSCLTTFGLSVKESENPFGYFGTGLKYAVAILLREDLEICLAIDNKFYSFTKELKSVRGKEFSFISITYPDGTQQEMPFTTELGKNWELWQAYRELYCNTMDENGEILQQEIIYYKPATTYFVVGGKAFENIHENRNEFILSGNPAYKSNTLEVYRNDSKSIFFKGIKIGNIPYPSQFSYNILDAIELTEDRTLKSQYGFNSKVSEFILGFKSKEYVETIFNQNEESWELKEDFDYSANPVSDEFISFYRNLSFKKIKSPSLHKVFIRNTPEEDKKPITIKLTSIQEKQYEKALKFLKSLNLIDNYWDAQVFFSEDLGENALGIVYLGEIYLSVKVFHQGTKQVAATLLEEYLHLENGYRDLSYNFQTHLFDLIMTLGEEIAGEPL